MSNEFKFFCDKCNYGTNNKMSMVVHEHTTLHLTGKHGKLNFKKSDKKIYKCDICQTTYSSKANLFIHNLNNHSTKEERKKGYKFYCDLCNIGYMDNQKYTHHLTTQSHKNIYSIVTNQLQNINLSNTPILNPDNEQLSV